tara:strand:- start:921 stop:1406 length:486 start_codon:yes stop_codon:yes gene_type:complete
MNRYSEIDGDLISLAKQGKFDVIAHGCNCFCNMGSGIAPQMAEAFNCDKYSLEHQQHKGDINKLGTINFEVFEFSSIEYLKVVNAYTQYRYGKDKVHADYSAIRLCFKKMNKIFNGSHIGLPKIGSGKAGGNWEKIKKIMKEEFTGCNVTVVNYVVNSSIL